MSGCSYENPCPVCGKPMSFNSDWKPVDTLYGLCLNCGLNIFTNIEQASLKEVNEQRAENDLPPLKKADLLKWKKDIKEL